MQRADAASTYLPLTVRLEPPPTPPPQATVATTGESSSVMGP